MRTEIAVWYELWGTDSGNIIADYETEDEALAFVAQYIEANGRGAVADWVLGQTGDNETNDAFVAEGDALADLATRQRVEVGD